MASKGKSVNSTRTKLDAVALLKADHRQVEEWFEDFEKARSDDRKVELAANICNALTVHAHPTLPETLMEAAEAVHSKAVHIFQKPR